MRNISDIGCNNKRLLNVNQLNIKESPVNNNDVVELATLNYAILQVFNLSTLKEEVLEFDIGAGQNLWKPWVLELFGVLSDSKYFEASTLTTPSAKTGPSALPPIGNFYCFIESSSLNFGTWKFVIVRSDLSKVKSIFNSRNGDTMCDFGVEYFNGVDWITESTLTGNFGNV